MLHNIYSSSGLLLFFGGICLLSAIQFALILLVIRYLRQSIYADLQDFFTKPDSNTPSEFEKIAIVMADNMGARLYKSIEAAAAGSQGGTAEHVSRGPKPKGGVMGMLQSLAQQYLVNKVMGGGSSVPETSPSNGQRIFHF